MGPSTKHVGLVVAVLLLAAVYMYRLHAEDRSISENGGLLRPTKTDPIFEVVVDRVCPPVLKSEARPGHAKGRPIQFIHVPKAGGTSVQESLEKWAILHGIPTLLHDGDGPSWNSPGSRGLLLGHRGYGFSAKVMEKVPLTIVALREPVSRIISLFDYLRRTDETVPSVVQIKKAWQKKTLDEVVESYASVRETDPQSLLPGGSASFSDRTLHRVLQAQLQFLCGYDCVWYMTGDSRESMKPFEGQDVLGRARANLAKIDCVAVLNRLDDLLVQMKANFDFIPKTFNAFPHENTVNPEEKSQPSERTLQLLKEWTADERALFENARAIAEKKTAQAAQCLLNED
jgi:hypothetical protein